MKKILVLLMGIVLAGNLMACGNSGASGTAENSASDLETSSEAAASQEDEAAPSGNSLGEKKQTSAVSSTSTIFSNSSISADSADFFTSHGEEETENAFFAASEPLKKEQEKNQEKEQDSLALLRQNMDEQGISFGAAYLGYVGGLFDEEFSQAFPAWLKENNEKLLREYPFISEIDLEHILGRAGCLYCIVPRDEDASVAINRVTWNEKTQRSEVTEVLYRAESGEPVLLFANTDEIYNDADTQVFITDKDGNTSEWYPSLDEEGNLWPCLREDGTYASWDFTNYWYQTDSDLEAWLKDGWLGPTDLGLAGAESTGQTWTAAGTAWESERKANFSLCFYPGDEEGGRVELSWYYTGEMEEQEQWSGFWTIQSRMDEPSLLTISLSLTGGQNYGSTDGPVYISETYPVLVDLSGMHLVFGRGEYGICLPFMSQADLANVLTLQ